MVTERRMRIILSFTTCFVAQISSCSGPQGQGFRGREIYLNSARSVERMAVENMFREKISSLARISVRIYSAARNCTGRRVDGAEDAILFRSETYRKRSQLISSSSIHGTS